MLKIVLAFAFSVCVFAYKTGAPDGACDRLVPNHGVEAQSPETNPYKLTVSAETINSGEEVSVTLVSDDKVKFKGFLVVAKLPDTGEAVGTMAPKNDYSKPYVVEELCGGAGITHSVNWTNAPYHMLPFVWKSPSDFEGIVTFYATGVQEMVTFWPNFEGDKVVFVSNSEPKTTTVVETEPMETEPMETEPIEIESEEESVPTSTNTTDAPVPTTTEFEFEELPSVDEDVLDINSTVEIYPEDDTNSTTPGENGGETSGAPQRAVSIWMLLYLVLGSLMFI